MGRAGQGAAPRRRPGRRHRPGPAEQPQPAPGPLPGPHPVPHLRRPRRPGQLRRAHPPRQRGAGQPGQVQEHDRDPAVQQVEGALRAGPRQGRHRHRRHHGDLRGLHRRHRVPPRGRAPGRGHLRHGADRRPRAAVEPVRGPPAGPGLRRRQRGRPPPSASTTGSGSTRSRWRWPTCLRARIRRTWPAPTRPGWPRRWKEPRRFCASCSTGPSPAPTCPATRGGPGPRSGRSRSWPSTPPTWCATSTSWTSPPTAASSPAGCASNSNG